MIVRSNGVPQHESKTTKSNGAANTLAKSMGNFDVLPQLLTIT